MESGGAIFAGNGQSGGTVIDEGLQVVAFCPLKMRIISEKNHAERSEI